MRALVTGANGLIGSNIVRALLRRGYAVRAFVRPTSDLRSLQDQDVELAYGDILEPETVEAAAAGCAMIFHVAAVFAYWGYTPEELNTIAAQGTTNVVNAAHRAGVERIVLTSSSAVLGSDPQPRARDETAVPDLEAEPPYVRAKAEQERIAFARAEELDLDLVAVCPTIAVGGPDFKPTESNRMIVSYLTDDLKATWIGGCNIVSVVDVAEGHVIAAERGVPGTRYILGAENLTWKAVHRTLSELTGLPGPWLTAWHTSALLAATAYEFISHFTGEPPPSSRSQAKMVGRYYWYTHQRMAQLGYAPRPARRALAEAVSYLAASRHIPDSVRASMKLAPEIYELRQSAGYPHLPAP